MRKIVGKYLSMPALLHEIEKEKDPEARATLIMLLIPFLRHPEVRRKKSWDAFGVSFMKHFSKEIHRYCGYDSGALEIQKIPVKHRALFVECMSAIWHSGLLDCTQEELVTHLDMIFNTGYSTHTISNHIKRPDNNFSSIYDLILTEKRRINRENTEK